MMHDSAKTLSLSVVMIAHNEAHRIRRSLDSVKELAQEIIVVVNDCTDNTEQIAREEYGALVYEHDWHGHRDQKNIALKYAKQPWVLCLDADEELSPQLQDALIKFVTSPPPEINGAYFPRKVWFLGRWITHGDWYPDHSLRLIRNGRGIWRGSREHDKMDLDGNALELQGDLYHYSNPTMNSQLRKLEYFSDIFLQRQLESGKRWSAISAIFRGFWRFFRAYIFRLGFLDGFPGFYIAWFTAFSTFYRHSRMYEHLNHTEYPPDA
tara:strand:- start:1239 stop:2036 length:798 start_codon:yes stop_codon:yes gene_type:complete